MIEIKQKKECSGCSACSAACPVNAIKMCEDEEGFLYPVIDENRCIQCGKCNMVCPVQTAKYIDMESFPIAYLCYEENNEKRILSAAGGAFSSIAESFLKKMNGIVVGAVYGEKFHVHHECVRSVESLQRMKKSKYVQSEMGIVFKEILTYLEQGEAVLFSGTPCQVAGLKRLVPLKLQEKLYCVDLSCFGVPSPAVFSRYIEDQVEQHGEINEVIIRDKKLNKATYRIGYGIKFKSGYKYFAPHGIDPMARIFYSRIALRPVCYDCPFKTVSRTSDLTLGDCWYADVLCEGVQDKYGVTMVLQHSVKGQALLEMADSLKQHEVDAETAIKVNGGMIFKSSPISSKRKEFFEDFISKEKIAVLADKYAPEKKDSLSYKIKSCIREFGIVPSKLVVKKRKQQVEKRCAQQIPREAMKKFV